ncbi:adenylate/guanylate cyclase domain-containing protein [Prochlorothrix hollandica]|nr:adenylate/guanylate cyclase domain-containing protein [Prochlorothrix hollandica]
MPQPPVSRSSSPAGDRGSVHGGPHSPEMPMNRQTFPINLDQLVTQQRVVAILEDMGEMLHSPIWIMDSHDRCIFGGLPPATAHRVPIHLEDKTLGWVLAQVPPIALGHTLSLLAEREAERQALAYEVLDIYREINLLYKVSATLASHLEPTEIAELAIEEALHIIRGNSASVMLLNEEAGKLAIIAGCGTASHLIGKPIFDTKDGIAGNIFSSGQGEIINDVMADRRFVAGKNPVSSIICAPLCTKDSVLGVINISSEDPAYYKAKDLKLLTALGTQVASAIENAQLHQNKLKQERIRSQLRRYIPAQLANAIVDSNESISLAPAHKKITILFSDIRNFTSQCEILGPEEIVGYLNEYFTAMVDVIFQNQGTVNKFVGDMIVAMFGAPTELPNNEENAVKAAIEMQRCLRDFPNPWIRENFITGIGITSGSVVVGNIGSPHHLDYTAIGDEVNLASRLQSIAKGGQVLVSSNIYAATRHIHTYRNFGNLHVKGKQESVEVFQALY